MRRAATKFVAISLLLAVGAIPGFCRAQSSNVYNGHWWLSVSPDVQYGFLNGYWDCYIDVYHGSANYLLATTVGMRQHVTAFYRDNPSKLRMPVPEVMYQFRAPKGAQPPQGGETHNGPHGFYTGQWWGATYQTDLGYVEGYLWCWRNCLHNKGGTFSKTPEEYVKLIDGYYQLNPKTTINARREPTPIAYVLYSFRDGQQPPRCSGK